MSVRRITGAYEGLRGVPRREEREASPIPRNGAGPVPEHLRPGFYRKKAESGAEPEREAQPRHRIQVPPRRSWDDFARERRPLGAPRLDLPDRPKCPRCSKPAASRGTSPGGKKRWHCSTCRRAWTV